MESGQQVGRATFVAAVMLLGAVPFLSGCGGKSASDIARCLQKAGLSTEQLRLGVRHYSGTTLKVGSSGPSVSTRLVPALVVYIGANRATMLLAKTEDQATDDGAAPENPVGPLTAGTLIESYGNNVVIWQRRPDTLDDMRVGRCMGAKS